MNYLIEIGKKAKEAYGIIGLLGTTEKNNILNQCAKQLINNTFNIIEENKKDLEHAINLGVKGALIDRLTLNEGRIKSMAEGIIQIANLDDPIGEMVLMKTLPNGLVVGQKRVAMGVIGMIYEARPNVTADAFALCFKAGSAVILRGGKEAINSNKIITQIFANVLKQNNLPQESIQLIEDTSRETAVNFMKLNRYVDVLIPRGGAGLIQSAIENSTIPVIETGTGNCHIFVDETANFDKAIKVIINAKVQRPGVCNSCEKLLIHKSIANKFLPLICEELYKYNVEIRGDKEVCKIIPSATLAIEEDWGLEYLDYIIGIKIVDGIEEAINHIKKYSSGHSEVILTESYSNSQIFLQYVDSAVVYVNASTRFTDGSQFGFGAELGISTQKLHARGPMGLKELTTTKYIVYGNGQIRE